MDAQIRRFASRFAVTGACVNYITYFQNNVTPACTIVITFIFQLVIFGLNIL